MPLVPLKQEVTVVRPGVTDKWGRTTDPTEFTLKCRFSEETKMTRRTSSTAQVTSSEVVSTATILFDKFTDIQYADVIKYTDESDKTRQYEPINIKRLRDFGGKVLFTVVEV